MARMKSPTRGTQARGSRARNEWSCRVCTLLNDWRERRCGACDVERPADVESQPSEWNCEVCTLANEWTVLRCAACEHERPTPAGSNAPASNSERRNEPAPAPLPLSGAPTTDESTWTTTGEATPPRSSRKRRRTPTKQRFSNAPTIAQERLLSTQAGDTKKDSTETVCVGNDGVDVHASFEDVPAAPTFNLLSFVNSAAASPEPLHTGRRAIDGNISPQDFGGPSFNLLGGSTIDLTETAADGKPVSTNSDDSDSQLAKAGLRLSDSESEDDGDGRGRSKRVLRRRLSRQPTSNPPPASPHFQERLTADQDEWECPVCTNLNPARSAACELCNTNRDRSGATERKPSDLANTMVSCVVCSHLNPAHSTACEACSSRISQTGAEATFTCLVCTNVNPVHLDQCEMCETKRRALSCPVCTSLNDASRKRCEVCESLLDEQPMAEHSRSVRGEFNKEDGAPRNTHNEYRTDDDIYGAQADRYRADSFDSDSRVDRESDGDFEDDFVYGGNPSSPTPTRMTGGRDLSHYRDRVEDISDNEAYSRLPTDTHQSAQSRRPELREFEHFLTVEDARLDYQCQIDYRSMFAESSRSRSYADRLQKRRRESQKRKRTAAEKSSNQQPTKEASTKGRGKKKAAKAGGKRAKNADRRASTPRPPAKIAKKPCGTAKSRRSSAPTQSAGINHYDTLGDDIGDDVTTMAWEGVGSAGYF